MERLRYKKTTQDISVNKYLSIYPYLLLFKSTTVEKCSWKIVFLGNICLLFHMLFFPTKFLKNICRFFLAIGLLLSATLLKVEVLHRLVSYRNNTWQKCQLFSCSHRDLFLEVASVRPLCSKCLKIICEVFKTIKLG